MLTNPSLVASHSLWQIYFTAPSEGEQSITVDGGNAVSGTTSELTPNTTYTFSVTATNGGGEGTRSSVMPIKTDFDGMQ